MLANVKACQPEALPPSSRGGNRKWFSEQAGLENLSPEDPTFYPAPIVPALEGHFISLKPNRGLRSEGVLSPSPS